MQVYSRSPGVVWRVCPDGVLVRRVAVPDGMPRDLGGAAALVWISLDEPATVPEILERIAGAGLAVDPTTADAAIRLLVDEQLVVVGPTDH